MKKEGKEQVHERQAGRIKAQSQTTAPPALMSSLVAIPETLNGLRFVSNIKNVNV
jgi:hypothetical protein